MVEAVQGGVAETDGVAGLLEAFEEGALIVDATGTVRGANARAVALLGATLTTGKPLPADIGLLAAEAGRDPRWSVRTRPLRWDGQEARLLLLQDAAAAGAERQRLKLLDALFEAGSEAAMVTDADAHILEVNSAFERITGYSRAEVLGRTPAIIRSGRHDEAFYERVWAAVRAHGHWQGEITNRRRSGDLFPAWLNITAVLDGDGRRTHYVSTIADLSEARTLGGQVQRLTQYDALTDLPNRSLLMERCEQALRGLATDGPYSTVALLVFAVERLRLVNDTLGLEAGDQLLCQVAQRLAGALRPGDFLARLGAGEFAVLCTGHDDAETLGALARSLQAESGTPLNVLGHEIFCGSLIGIARCDLAARCNAEQMLAQADVALDRARAEGRNGIAFFAAKMNASAGRWLTLEWHLRRAMERHELELHYQPQIAMGDGAVVGCEALLRWNCADLGRISPGEFIPLAEEIGLIVPIGTWVLREACEQAQRWIRSGNPPLRVSVNVSALQFVDGALPDLVARVLQETGLDPRWLTLEITESVMLQDAAAVQRQMEAITTLGVRFALDDFGTGYASLGYLATLPLHFLKIDQSFVARMVTDTRSATIARSAILLGTSLGMQTVAEGIETEAQLNYLRRLGCDEAQGYLLGRPALAAAMTVDKAVQALLRNPDPADLSRRTLLCVDDEPGVLASLRRLFRQAGYRVLAATSGSEALELLARNRVQVVVSDQRMPEMNGTEFLRRVAALHPDTVRLVLSGYADMETILAAINEGAIFRFVGKPWDDEQLRTHVREAFGLWDHWHAAAAQATADAQTP